MRTTAQRLTLAAASISVALALPTAAFAQRRLEPVQVTAAATARADALHAKANTMIGSTKRSTMRKMAAMHEQSAEMRRNDDAQAFDCLRQAAFLRYYSGDRRNGVDRMSEAATRAADRGDVINAAEAYIDAAVIAGELRDGTRMAEYRARAELLSTSPLIDATQRLRLRARLDGDAQVASIAQR